MFEDEEVEKEIDVYLSKGLVDNLYLFQYPTRPRTMTYDDSMTLASRVKPKQQKVEIELSLDTQTSYDRNKGEQIALNVDGRNKNSDNYFDSPYMDKVLLTSMNAVSSTSPYAVGLLKQGELHITPLHSILQLQPSFSYLDRSDTQAKLENKDEEDEDAAEEQITAVNSKFAGADAAKAKLARERSYHYAQQKSANEPWIDVSYHHYKSNRSNVEQAMLICSQMDRDSSNMTVTPNEYVKALVPETLVSSGVKPVRTLQSIRSIRCLPPTEQVKALMSSAKVLRFRQLTELLPPGTDSTNLERVLQQIAILVQGCWVVKSEILYPKNSASRLTGIGGDVLTSVRDYILWCFTKSRCITRSEILAVIKVPNDDITEILGQVSRKIRSRGWEFKYPFDKEFVEDHPGVVQRQQMLWDARYKQLIKELKLGQMDSKSGDYGQMAVPSPQRPHHRRQLKYLRDSISDDTEGSASEGSSIERMDVDVVRRRRNFKRNAGSRSGEHSPVKNAPRSRHGSYIATLEVSPTFINEISPESKAVLLKLMKEKLKKHYCMTFDGIKERVLDGNPNFSGLSDSLLEEILLEAGAQRVRNKWPQNTPPQPLFAFTKFGDKYDRYRDALLDLFSNTARSRPNFLVKKFEDEFGEVVSDADCKQIFEEYCIYKSGYYYLKGTIRPDS